MAERKRKIIFVVTKGNWGGVQRYVYDLATALSPSRWTPVAALGQGSVLADKLAVVGIACRPVPALGRDINLLSDLAAARALYRLFKTEQPDIIHLNSSKAGLLGALAGRLARAPKIIFTAHGWAFNEDRGRIARWSIKILHWLTILTVHLTIVVSEATKRQMARWPGTKQKMTVIYNGVRPIIFEERNRARAVLLGARAADRPGLWLGTISELHKNKGLTYLLSALATLRVTLAKWQGLPLTSLTVIIIGEGEERANLERQIKVLGLEQTVFLVGHKNDAATLLSAFDLFILTSITEAFPYVLLEAGLAGLPVVASAIGGVPEIITSMESGILIRPREPREIAQALEFLSYHPEKRRHFGATLRRKIKTELSTNKMVRQTMAVYDGVNEFEAES